MTLEEKAGSIIVSSLSPYTGEDKAVEAGTVVVRKLYGSGIHFREETRSTEMSTRFHSHLSWIVRHAPGEDRDQLYSRILNEAVNRGAYPFTIVQQRVTINSAVFDVEVKVPYSTTRASNREMLVAYGILEEVAAELSVVLPERESAYV